MGYYHTAQVCLNGHAITDNYDQHPEFRKKFCPKCGQETITACQSCGNPIQGDYECEGVVAIGFKYHPPSFCHNCGKPFPWTAAALEAATELTRELETLSAGEQQELASTLPDLVRDSPRTNTAMMKFKRLTQKAGKEAYGMFRDILTDVVSETVKKTLFDGF